MPGSSVARPSRGQRRDRDRRLAHGLGRVAVGDDAVDDRPVELVEVAELVERGGDLGVRGVGHGFRVRGLMPGPAWLVLPTYNEAENLEAIVRAAREALAPAAPDGYRILVVDDASPDGTGAIADGLAGAHDEVQVLHRPAKGGLGPRLPRGLRRALARGRRLRDGDGLRLLARPGRPRPPARRGARRSRPGARLALRRRAAASPTGRACAGPSAAAGAGTRARALGLDVRDLTGGFKCFRREVLEAIDLPTVRSQGYAFQVELTYRAVLRGFRVVEVPIVFRERARGREQDVVADRARGDLASARSCASDAAERSRRRPRRCRWLRVCARA